MDYESLVQAISNVVATSLQALGHIGYGAKVGGNRGGGWLRAYLEDATEEESEIFAEAMQEVLGPLENPRYVIPREVRVISETWLSEMLPEVLAKFFRKKSNTLAMYHAVLRYYAETSRMPKCLRNSGTSRLVPGGSLWPQQERKGNC